MVSGLDIGRCVSKEAEPRRGVDTRRCASKDVRPRRGWIGGSHIHWRRERVPTRILGPKGGWIVRSHIGWRGERNILYKGVETSPYQTRGGLGVPRRLEKGTSVSKDTGPRRRWIVRSHILYKGLETSL